LYTTATFDKLPGRSQPLVNNSSRTTRLEALPKTMMLEQNYPNPFNPSTTIRYAVPEAGEISLKIYNLNGQLVKTLLSGVVTAGNHQVVWDGTDSSGSQVASGAYLYKLEAGDFVQTRKTVLLQ
ncbi:MAG: FlgD immunoglobulin-like domain containing protein, partial [Nitrospirales bacterium]